MQSKLGWFVRAAVLALLVSDAPAQALTLDAFSDPLPPNPCLPLSGQPVIFTGRFCDGDSCPPDPYVFGCDGATHADQGGLAGVLGGSRWSEVYAFAASRDYRIQGRVSPSAGRFEVSLPTSHENATVGFVYGAPRRRWNLDLEALGIVGFRVDVEGDISPERPLWIHVRLGSAHESSGGWAALDVWLTEAGEHLFPLSSFIVRYEYDPRYIDGIEVAFGECLGYCDVVLPPRRYSIGAFELVEGTPTAATGRSWGDLKVRYR